MKKLIPVIFFLLMAQTVMAVQNVNYNFCDVTVQGMEGFYYGIEGSYYVLHVKNCYGYNLWDYTCNVKNSTERFLSNKYTFLVSKDSLAQQLKIGEDYRVQGPENSNVTTLVNDSRDLQTLAKEYCSKTLGQDYGGQVRSWFDTIAKIVTMFLSAILIVLLPQAAVILAILLIILFIYRKWKKKALPTKHA
jgi:hypothetical protein